MENSKNISIKKIAELSGVSVATVSRVINNTGRFSEETRDKVLKIIKEYDYKPNMVAKSLRVNKSKTIGITVPDIKNGFFSEVVSEIEKFFFDHGYSVFICNTNRSDIKEIEYFKSLDSKLVDGIICISGNSSSHAESVKRNIPIVYINNCKSPNSYYVESDHFQGGFLATEELIKKGCKKIILLTNDRDDSASHSKYVGYIKAHEKYNLKINENLILKLPLVEGNFEDSFKKTSELIENDVEFDGIFATNDWRSHGALLSLQRHQISVPQEVKIIGYDGTYISKYCNPPISTIYQDKKALAIKSSYLLLSLIKGDYEEEKHIILPIKLINRETT